MKQDYPQLGIKKLCRLFGKTRHAWYVHQIRKSLPRTGTLKLLYMITPLLAEHGIRVGRDYLFELMGEHGLEIRRRKRRIITTDSRHWMHKYSNLVKDLHVSRPEQVWVSDITLCPHE